MRHTSFINQASFYQSQGTWMMYPVSAAVSRQLDGVGRSSSSVSSTGSYAMHWSHSSANFLTIQKRPSALAASSRSFCFLVTVSERPEAAPSVSCFEFFSHSSSVLMNLRNLRRKPRKTCFRESRVARGTSFQHAAKVKSDNLWVLGCRR